MGEVMRVARRELAAFFGSPVAYIFIGTFLSVCLFVFFWVDAFFARNIADARPLFEWMPILLVFLCAALTMRLWSEERRAGTLESLLTLPVATPKLVLGKFLAALGLVAVSLALTLPLPITVSLLGPLDWGPVIGAYLATLLLASAYLAIGLFVSSRTDNPIVALIGSHPGQRALLSDRLPGPDQPARSRRRRDPASDRQRRALRVHHPGRHRSARSLLLSQPGRCLSGPDGLQPGASALGGAGVQSAPSSPLVADHRACGRQPGRRQSLDAGRHRGAGGSHRGSALHHLRGDPDLSRTSSRSRC